MVCFFFLVFTHCVCSLMSVSLVSVQFWWEMFVYLMNMTCSLNHRTCSLSNKRDVRLTRRTNEWTNNWQTKLCFRQDNIVTNLTLYHSVVCLATVLTPFLLTEVRLSTMEQYWLAVLVNRIKLTLMIITNKLANEQIKWTLK